VEEDTLYALCLLRALRRTSTPPERVVFLGTTASVWNALAEQLPDCPVELMETFLTWEKSGSAPPLRAPEVVPTLKALAAGLSASWGLEVHCVAISELATAEEQRELVQVLRGLVAPGDTLSGDVTHSLGHIRIVLSQTLVALETLQGAHLRALYSGAFELRQNEITPTIRLDGLYDTVRLERGLRSAQRHGTLRDLVDALDAASPLRKPLSALADAWTLHQPESMRQHGANVLGVLRSLTPDARQALRGVEDFVEALTRQFQGRPAERQFASARASLVQGDLLRAALAGREACIAVARVAEQSDEEAPARQWLENYAARWEARSAYGLVRAWPVLQAIRNALAHATPPKTEVVTKAFREGPSAVSALLGVVLNALEQGLRDDCPAAFERGLAPRG